MAIEQAREHKYEKEVIARNGSKYYETVYPFAVFCDGCKKRAYKLGETPGDAADQARRDNFITVPSKSIHLPSKWQCRACTEKQDAKRASGLEAAFGRLQQASPTSKTG